MAGGDGGDTYYVDNANDKITETGSGGRDTVITTGSWTLGGGLEDLEVLNSGSETDIDLTGNELANKLTGNDGKNVLDGKAGADTMTGGGGDDTYKVDDAGDIINEDDDSIGGGVDTVVITASNITHTLATGVDHAKVEDDLEGVQILGNYLANEITGNNKANTLDGSDGSDTLDGGADNDFLHGGDGNDSIVGGTGNDTLSGSAGVDTLKGGAGDDLYYVSPEDKIYESENGGIDTVLANSTYTLEDDQEIEILVLNELARGDNTLTGNNLANTVIGNSSSGNTIDGGGGDDTVYGGESDDFLRGGDGADSLYGGNGNDTYYVNGSDTVFEDENTGDEDLVIVIESGTYTLADNVEYGEIKERVAGVHLIGNNGANKLTGNELSNTLDGGLGADTLIGGDGSDTYYVDAGDTVKEDTGGTSDHVIVTETGKYELAVGIENGTVGQDSQGNDVSGVRLTGNDQGNTLRGNNVGNTLDGGKGDDVLFGNDGDDVLIGGIGADDLQGGDGNDTYYIDRNDKVSDSSGIDTVVVADSGITYRLGNDIENGGIDAGYRALPSSAMVTPTS